MVFSGDHIIYSVKVSVDDTRDYMLKYVKEHHNEIYETLDFEVLENDGESCEKQNI
jgi:hypothetical protein